jgi:hypothetical protein
LLEPFTKDNALSGTPSQGSRTRSAMRLCRFADERFGLVRDGAIYDVTALAERVVAQQPAAIRYAMGLDMSLRGTEDRSMRKSIDGYSVLGP